jgi:selenium metabolism protein YedF
MELDVRGQACPIPVIKTRKALDAMEQGSLRVLVSTTVQAKNVTAAAEDRGGVVTRSEGDGHIILEIQKEKSTSPAAQGGAEPVVVCYLNSRFMGLGDDELGAVLMKAFLQTQKELTRVPGKMIFVNAAVYHTSEGSEHIDTLRALEDSGTEIISCGTCLDFYGLLDKLLVGRASNMFEILETLSAADRVLSP